MKETFREVRQLVKEGKVLEAEELARSNPNLNRGIQLLFNGDAWIGARYLVPRADWIVMSPYVIIETEEAEERRRIEEVA